MAEPDEIMQRIGEGIAASQRGDRPIARSIFEEVWEHIGGNDGDPFHRCALAHSMADVQDDPRDELAWDLRALEAASLLTDERVQAGGVAGAALGLFPSLHLNLADVYRRLGEADRALEHVRLGNQAVSALPDDGYGAMIHDGLARVEHRITEAGDESS